MDLRHAYRQVGVNIWKTDLKCSYRQYHICSHLGNTRPGRCPAVDPDVFGICVEACASDIDCTETQKCCSNGCGHVCMDPILEGTLYLQLLGCQG